MKRYVFPVVLVLGFIWPHLLTIFSHTPLQYVFGDDLSLLALPVIGSVVVIIALVPFVLERVFYHKSSKTVLTLSIITALAYPYLTHALFLPIHDQVRFIMNRSGFQSMAEELLQNTKAKTITITRSLKPQSLNDVYFTNDVSWGNAWYSSRMTHAPIDEYFTWPSAAMSRETYVRITNLMAHARVNRVQAIDGKMIAFYLNRGDGCWSCKGSYEKASFEGVGYVYHPEQSYPRQLDIHPNATTLVERTCWYNSLDEHWSFFLLSAGTCPSDD